jgi:hypothetical protein
LRSTFVTPSNLPSVSALYQPWPCRKFALNFVEPFKRMLVQDAGRPTVGPHDRVGSVQRRSGQHGLRNDVRQGRSEVELAVVRIARAIVAAGDRLSISASLCRAMDQVEPDMRVALCS